MINGATIGGFNGANLLDTDDADWMPQLTVQDPGPPLPVENYTYATRISAQYGNFTKRTTTGLQDIILAAGFGRPRVVYLWWSNQTATGYAAGQSGGFGVIAVRAFGKTSPLGDVSRGYIAWASDNNVGTSNRGKGANTNACIKIFSDGTPTIADVADVLPSFDWPVDGFRLNWTTSSASAKIIHYLALSGTDVLDAYVGSFTGPAAPQSQGYTGVGFKGNFILPFSGPIASLTDNAGQINGIGAAVSTTRKAACAWAGVDGATVASRTKSRNDLNACWISLSNAAPPALDQRADFTSFDSDGFTLDHTTVGVASPIFLALVIQGINVDVQWIATPAGTGTVDYQTPGKPVGVLLIGAPVNSLVFNVVQNEAHALIGGGDAATEGSVWTGDDDTATTDANSRTVTDKILQTSVAAAPASPILEADLSALTAQGFTLNYTVAAQRNIIAIAFLENQPAAEKIPLIGQVGNRFNKSIAW